MSRLIQIFLSVAALAVLAGCATTGNYDNYLAEAKARESARQARLEVLAADCQDDLCRVMIAQEISEPLDIPQPQAHPGWRLAETFLGTVVPAASNFLITRENRRETIGIMDAFASIERADHSITVGGNYGDTDNSNHGRIDSPGDEIGGDYWRDNGRVGSPGDEIGRDQYRDNNRVRSPGNEFGGDGCVGSPCRNTSPGPWTNPDPEPDEPEEGGDP